jgi:uncharacterized membrane protein YcaP (DUF421 family)
METATVRILFILICLGIGFHNLSGTRLADRTPTDLIAVLMAAGIGTMAVIQPETPFQVYLVPLIALILFYRLALLAGRLPEPEKRLEASSSEGSEGSFQAARLSGASGGPTGPPPMALPLIENGKVRIDNLNKLHRTQLWLRRELRHFGYRDLRQIRYLTIDRFGNFFMDLDDDRRK